MYTYTIYIYIYIEILDIYMHLCISLYIYIYIYTACGFPHHQVRVWAPMPWNAWAALRARPWSSCEA